MNDYVDYADATGAILRLPVAPGFSCQSRKAPADLTPAEIASMVADLPPAPTGYAWQRKNCSIVDGPWVIDPNQPGFTAIQTNQSSIAINDRANEELVGYSKSNTSVN